MTTSLFRQTIRDAFDKLAAEAIEQGLLTAEQRDTLKRSGTRKRSNYVRHLQDLCALIECQQFSLRLPRKE